MTWTGKWKLIRLLLVQYSGTGDEKHQKAMVLNRLIKKSPIENNKHSLYWNFRNFVITGLNENNNEENLTFDKFKII